jgi:hypothetical protein
MQTSGAVDTLALLLGTLFVRLFTSCNLHNSARMACCRWDLGISLLDFGRSVLSRNLAATHARVLKVRRSVPRRGNRTEPGVLTPGRGVFKRGALKAAPDWRPRVQFGKGTSIRFRREYPPTNPIEDEDDDEYENDVPQEK